MFNKSDLSRDAYQLYGKQAEKGYDWWWHSFTAIKESDGSERPFYIEFFLTNPNLGKDEPVFGQLGEECRPSYLMVNVGTWGTEPRQLHRFFGYNRVRLYEGYPFTIEAGDCFLSETKTAGSVNVSEKDAKTHPEYLSDAGSVSWNLSIEKVIPFNVGYGASKLFRKLQCFEMFWHAEGMKTFFEGEIIYNGERYIVKKENCFGYSDKNWGKDFTSPWLWLSSNNLYSKKFGRRLENSVFDIGGGKPKIYFLSLKGKLLSAFYYEGACYEFNFSKFWHFVRTRFSCKEFGDEIIWSVVQKTWTLRLEVDIRCKKSEMLLINYESPDGKKRHNRLWNGGNGIGVIRLYRFGQLIDEIEVRNAGCEYGEYDQKFAS